MSRSNVSDREIVVPGDNDRTIEIAAGDRRVHVTVLSQTVDLDLRAAEDLVHAIFEAMEQVR